MHGNVPHLRDQILIGGAHQPLGAIATHRLSRATTRNEENPTRSFFDVPRDQQQIPPVVNVTFLKESADD